jgi:hypothetical protein
MRRGRQQAVPAPGKNHKLTIFGAWRYGHGQFRHYTQPRGTHWGCRVLLQQLVRRAKRTGRRIILVMDQGKPHHAKALHHDLQNVKEHVQVFWLPHYCPDLNLIERLWKHLKHSRLANVLFRQFQAFREHVDKVLNDFARNPDYGLSIITPSCRAAIRKQRLVAT